MLNKQCSRCKTDKTFKNFNVNRDGKHGLSSICKLCCNLSGKKYREENLYRIWSRHITHRQGNRDKIKQRNKRYREDNPDKLTQCSKKWQGENLDKKRVYEANRRALKLNQTPPWADLQAIQMFYKNVPQDCHIDHTIPLSKGGYHSMENLQYLTAFENCSKGNKWDYTVENESWRYDI